MNRNIVYLIGFVLLFVSIIFAVLKYDRQLTLQAYKECAEISQFVERRAGGTTISYPLPDFYDPCIERVNQAK